MKERFCGEAKIELEPNGKVSDGERENLLFKGRIVVGPDWWEFDRVQVQTDTESEEAYDIAAAGAMHYGSLYGTGYDPQTDGGEIPDWAPPADFADTINDSASLDEKGFCIRREIDGVDTYSG